MDILGLMIHPPPKITKYLTFSLVSISLLLWFNLVNPIHLYLNFSSIFHKCQLWRLFTTFFFFGEFNLLTLFQIFIFYQNSTNLEKLVFKGNASDYLYFLMLLMTFLLLLSPFIDAIFLTNTLDFAMTYYWGRKCKNMRIQVFVFTLRAPYYPWFNLLFSYLLDFDLRQRLFGFLVGHIIYYFSDIMPRIKGMNGLNIFKTPEIVKRLCEKLNLNNEVAEVDNEAINMFM